MRFYIVLLCAKCGLPSGESTTDTALWKNHHYQPKSNQYVDMMGFPEFINTSNIEYEEKLSENTYIHTYIHMYIKIYWDD